MSNESQDNQPSATSPWWVARAAARLDVKLTILAEPRGSVSPEDAEEIARGCADDHGTKATAEDIEFAKEIAKAHI